MLHAQLEDNWQPYESRQKDFSSQPSSLLGQMVASHLGSTKKSDPSSTLLQQNTHESTATQQLSAGEVPSDELVAVSRVEMDVATGNKGQRFEALLSTDGPSNPPNQQQIPTLDSSVDVIQTQEATS